MWDHVGFNPETKFALTVVPGKRGIRNIRRLVKDVAARTNFVLPRLITTDMYKPYRQILREVYGIPRPVRRRFRRGRMPLPRRILPKGMVYAAVHKYRRSGRVVRVLIRRIFGSERELTAALKKSTVSRHVNVAYVERYNATDRHINSRKGRKVYRFSKDPQMHEAATYYAQAVYNFCRANRGLDIKTGSEDNAPVIHRTPAMAQGITDHLWTIEEFARYQACPPVT